jgi:hypothetical protein
VQPGGRLVPVGLVRHPVRDREEEHPVAQPPVVPHRLLKGHVDEAEQGGAAGDWEEEQVHQEEGGPPKQLRHLLPLAHPSGSEMETALGKPGMLAEAFESLL